MAITVDVAALGTNYGSGTSGSIAFTTGSAVASGGFIVLSVGHVDDSISSVSGGGLTWSVDKAYEWSGGGFARRIAIVSAQAPAGLASSTSITASFVGSSAQVRLIGGMSFMGVATSSPVDGTPLGSNADSVAAWTSGSYAISAGSVVVAASYSDSNSLNVATSPSVEAWEYDDVGDGVACATEYRIESSAGSYAVEGTWNDASSSSAAAVAYKVAAGGGGQSSLLFPHRMI